MINNNFRTFALETYARRSLNYFNRMVDKDGLPYFNIFWTKPAEATHVILMIVPLTFGSFLRKKV